MTLCSNHEIRVLQDGHHHNYVLKGSTKYKEQALQVQPKRRKQEEQVSATEVVGEITTIIGGKSHLKK
jgi:hypothetical protein